MGRHHDAMVESLGKRPEFMVTLEVAVPLWVQRWRGRPADQRIARAKSLGQIVASHGDQILYRSKGRAPRVSSGVKIAGTPGTASAFNALAEGIALLALQPGGATIFGRHFHDRCRAGPPEDWHPPLVECRDLG